MDPLIIAAGDLAFLDSFAGFVPVRIQAITGPSGEPSTSQVIEYVVTAARPGYNRGDVDLSPGTNIVPRAAVGTSGGRYVFRAAWTVQAD
jgi:hypothetical protein